MKSTAIAPANIAFIKYWGRKNEELRLPANSSISMNLSNLTTTTTVEFNPNLIQDVVAIKDIYDDQSQQKVVKHLDRVRKIAQKHIFAKIVSQNSFPSSTGLSSSASGFAALSLAAVSSIGLTLSEKDLSILARQGSGSACRSIPGGFVEWLDGDTSETSYSQSIFPANYWQICDVVAVISENKKEVSTSDGQKLAFSSPFYKVRLENIKKKISLLKQYLKDKDFPKFGELIEAEALELHSIMLTSQPALIYLTPETIQLIKQVKSWRNQGLPVFITLNTGQDAHLICEEKNVDQLKVELNKLNFVKQIIVNSPSQGAHLSDKHLF